MSIDFTDAELLEVHSLLLQATITERINTVRRQNIISALRKVSEAQDVVNDERDAEEAEEALAYGWDGNETQAQRHADRYGDRQ